MEESSSLVIVDTAPVSAKQLQQQVNAIQEAMQQVMKDGVHYGKVPGCGDKPALLKPGAEKIGLMFRLLASFEHTREDLPGGHREYTLICTLRDPSGRVVGQGVGSASTMESKHRYRNSQKKCPNCGGEFIIKGKEEYGGGWLCHAKRGGCGTKFQDGDKQIEAQTAAKIENPDIADLYNTVLKMAKKRSHVDAILTATAASDCFTQDIEDMGPLEYGSTAKVSDFKPIPKSKSEPEEFYWYDLSSEELSKDRLEYLKRRNCVRDIESGLWFCENELDRVMNKYRTEAPQIPNDDEVAA